MKKNVFIIMGLMALLLSSCHTPNLAYFTDLNVGETKNVLEGKDVRFRVGDKLSIVVTSRDPQLSALFNLQHVTSYIGTTQSTGNVNSGGNVLGYIIDSHGEIDFPVLGKIKVIGYKREEVASMIKQELMKRNLVNDPVVTVNYAGLAFNVLGEVSSPGRYYIDRDRMTLMDALSMAGDLTLNGKRDNVMVLRANGDTRTMYRVNLQSADELHHSPVYYVQQDDIVYVEPTKKRSRESTVNGNLLYTPTFWMSLTSFLLTVSLIILK